MNCLTVRPKRNWSPTEIDRVFEDFFRWPTQHQHQLDGFAPRVNINENDNEITLVFELPGMNKSDIKVTLVDGVLTVSGQRDFKRESKEGQYYRQEIRGGEFSRSFTLPDTIDSDKISADYKNGFLEIALTKLEEVKPKEIEVKVS